MEVLSYLWSLWWAVLSELLLLRYADCSYDDRVFIVYGIPFIHILIVGMILTMMTFWWLLMIRCLFGTVMVSAFGTFCETIPCLTPFRCSTADTVPDYSAGVLTADTGIRYLERPWRIAVAKMTFILTVLQKRDTVDVFIQYWNCRYSCLCRLADYYVAGWLIPYRGWLRYSPLLVVGVLSDTVFCYWYHCKYHWLEMLLMTVDVFCRYCYVQ